MRFEGNVPVRGKRHPVDGFSVPRAGGGTAPVPPDESHLLRQQQQTSLAEVFCCYDEERERFEGNVPVRGKTIQCIVFELGGLFQLLFPHLSNNRFCPFAGSFFPSDNVL